MADNTPKPILPYLKGRLGELIQMRFWSKVDVRGPDECWDWQASVTTSGYGRFKIASHEQVVANRFALISTKREEPAGLHVLHSCDRPICCNPAHLRFGTNQENMDDKSARGRCYSGDQAGALNGAAKLSDADLELIVRRLEAGWNNKRIAADMPIGHALVSRIRTGKSWAAQSRKLGWTARPQFSRLSALSTQEGAE